VQRNWIGIAIAVAVAIMLYSYLQQGTQPSGPAAQVSYSSFRDLLDENKVTAVTMRGDELQATLTRPVEIAGREVAVVTSRLPPVEDSQLLPDLKARGVEITAEPEPETGWFGAILPWLLLIGLYLFFWYRMSSRMPGGMGGAFDKFLKGRAGEVDAKRSKVTFAEVAGQDGAKAEVAELIEFLRDPDRFVKLGAEAPRGILLMGPPGTGKTLLARALAGEAGVPFFHISASEFIEMFVGVGASRVRAMFDEAKKKAPAIIFIDELDAIGRVRGAGVGGGHDEREQTLNQILSEMDGFEGHEAVIVLAATNRPDVLDPALLRPGRFDRHVTLDLPDRAAREAILKVHVRNKPLAVDADIAALAGGTPGLSGADLKNLVNEAAIASARDRASQIAMRHFDAARDRITLGMERRLEIRPEEKHRLAVHEAGHTAVAHFLPNTDPVYKVTIIPRGRALGGTHLLPTEERYTQSAGELRDRLAVLLAGRANEQALLGDVSSGADDDIRQVTRLARAMVTRWGMSEKLGPIDLRQSEEHPFLGREIAQAREYSDVTAHEVDEEVRRLLRDAEARAVELLTTHRPAVARLIGELEKHETLDRDTIVQLLRSGNEAKRAVGG
jgi:cell division protease FtsH